MNTEQEPAPCYLMNGSEQQGWYELYATSSFKACHENAPSIISAIGSIPYDHTLPFTISDYGAADGAPSLRLFSEIIRKIRELHGKKTSFALYYEDQETNDFKSLFLRLNGRIDNGYKLPKEGVYTFATATNFYERCYPSQSVHFGFSCYAMQWLSKRPLCLDDAMQCHQSKDAEAEKCFAQQAAKDWITILENRAHELVPGGLMVIFLLARDAKGQYSAAMNDTLGAYVVIDNIWKSMCKEGLISKDEYKRATFMDYFRTEEEITKPFNDQNCSVYKLGLKLESCEFKYITEPYEDWLKSCSSDDPCPARTYAHWYANLVKTFTGATIWECFSDRRTPHEKNELLDTLINRVEEEVAENPAQHCNCDVYAVLRIRKIAQSP